MTALDQLFNIFLSFFWLINLFFFLFLSVSPNEVAGRLTKSLAKSHNFSTLASPTLIK